MSRFAHFHPEDPEAAMERAIENAEFQADCERDRQMAVARPRVHYTGLLASTIRRLLNVEAPPLAFAGADAHQHQQNGMYGAHQLTVYMASPDGEPGQRYRVIIAPADAPITIGGVPANEHFAEPMGGEGR